jgi:dTDP-4-amino-4,6-dideoxygalactose transaminase
MISWFFISDGRAGRHIVSEQLAIEGGTPVRRKKLPYHRPSLGNTEEQLLLQAFHEGCLSGNGPYSQKLAEQLKSVLNVSGIFPTPSCTAALELSLLVANVGPGDEVITPSFGFVSTANAIVLRGAKPVFIDIEDQTFNLDTRQLPELITDRTKAILPVHYAGMPCVMETLLEEASKQDAAVVEDSAHCIGSSYRGRPLGSWGDFGTFSFHGTKNLVCGEGGALAVQGDKWLREVEIAYEKGTNRSAFLRGDIDKYTWIRPGSSFLLGDLLAAIMLGQLEKLDWVTGQRRAIAEQYLNEFTDLTPRMRLPVVPEGCEPNWHIFAVLVDPEVRDWTIKALNAEGIGATFHFVPLHSSPYAREHLGTGPGDFPVTERVASSLIRLPVFADMTPDDVQDVIDGVRKVIQSGEFQKKSNL